MSGSHRRDKALLQLHQLSSQRFQSLAASLNLVNARNQDTEMARGLEPSNGYIKPVSYPIDLAHQQQQFNSYNSQPHSLSSFVHSLTHSLNHTRFSSNPNSFKMHANTIITVALSLFTVAMSTPVAGTNYNRNTGVQGPHHGQRGPNGGPQVARTVARTVVPMVVPMVVRTVAMVAMVAMAAMAVLTVAKVATITTMDQPTTRTPTATTITITMSAPLVRFSAATVSRKPIPTWSPSSARSLELLFLLTPTLA